MTLTLRASTIADKTFLQRMLYEAVYWRHNPDKPSFETAIALPGVNNALEGWAERAGDTALVASANGQPVGAAWYRLYVEGKAIRGYLAPDIPVIVIAVQRDYRRRGVARRLLNGLIEQARHAHFEMLSLMVSKDNHAQTLYRQCGFVDHTDTGDSILMVRSLTGPDIFVSR